MIAAETTSKQNLPSTLSIIDSCHFSSIRRNLELTVNRVSNLSEFCKESLVFCHYINYLICHDTNKLKYQE